MSVLTVGVEEEFHILSRQTGRLTSAAAAVLSCDNTAKTQGDIKGEMPLSQLEITTPVCISITELHKSLSQLRLTASEMARKAGCYLVASGTPFSGDATGQAFAVSARYDRVSENVRSLVDEHLTAAAHVHVGVANADDAVAVVNASRAWLPALIALTANSPYWFSRQTGFVSWRTIQRSRWPISGPPPFSKNADEYYSRIERLVRSRALPEPSMVYWDVRLSVKYPTVEFRFSDTPLSVTETSMLAALVRALARTAIDYQSRSGALRGSKDIDSSLLRAAIYCAARDGLDASLPNPLDTRLQISAVDAVQLLLKYLAEALRANDEYDQAAEMIAGILANGIGATRQLNLVQEKPHIHAARDMANEMIRDCVA
jgi:glutamate---cysteine ligase / carboxylate-amine ligase